MQPFTDLVHRLSNIPALIAWAGYLGMTAIVFAETGLLIGFFLPGDSLLVTAGLLASSTGQLDIVLLGVLLSIAAIVGDSTGYAIGKMTGPRIFTREDSLLFRKRHLETARLFYEKHGGKTIIIARFMPVVRTFAPVVAGVGQMHYHRFIVYNVVGGLLWVWGLLLVGYYLGRIPGVSEYLTLIIMVVIFLSILPGIIHWLRERGRARRAASVLPRAGE